MDGDSAVILAGDLAALILAWLSGSVIQHRAASTSWRAAIWRGLGLGLSSLMVLLLLRQALPDLFVFPLLFLVTVALDVLTSRRPESPAQRYMISILISLSIVGVFVVVDMVLRAIGFHLTAAM